MRYKHDIEGRLKVVGVWSPLNCGTVRVALVELGQNFPIGLTARSERDLVVPESSLFPERPQTETLAWKVPCTELFDMVDIDREPDLFGRPPHERAEGLRESFCSFSALTEVLLHPDRSQRLPNDLFKIALRDSTRVPRPQLDVDALQPIPDASATSEAGRRAYATSTASSRAPLPAGLCISSSPPQLGCLGSQGDLACLQNVGLSISLGNCFFSCHLPIGDLMNSEVKLIPLWVLDTRRSEFRSPLPRQQDVEWQTPICSG